MRRHFFILARTQLERATDLYNHGALSQNDLQIAQDTEDKAKVDVETTEEHLRLFGSDPGKPKGIVDIDAPISGVITDQWAIYKGRPVNDSISLALTRNSRSSRSVSLSARNIYS